MPPIKGQMFRYSEADMEAAIAECRNGVPTATAARKYGVPRVTLLNKVKGKTPIKRKMGRSCYMTENIEKMLVTWTKAMVKQGFPIGKNNLQDSAKKIVDELNVVTPFKDGRPGIRWYRSFLKRNPDLITRQPQNLTASRASVSANQIKNWFGEVDNYLIENNCKDILKEPQRVFNMDETAFFLNPRGGKVLAAKGERSVYQRIASDEKECYTVLLGGNAAGDVLPPMVIFKYERIPKDLSLSIPESWGIGRSENGWMTMESFYEYICNIFSKWLDNNNIVRPVLLFIDGHTSHLSFHVSKFCSENGIILVALFPNATHLLQPMDVAVFRSLKGAWRAAVHSWRLENIDSPILRKVHFCPLLNKVLKNTCVPAIFQNGFRKCGLVPWNPDEVCCVMEPSANESNDLTEIQKIAKIKELELGINFLDKYIHTEKIAKFKTCDEFNGDREDIGLFKFYKSVESSLKNLVSYNTQSINISEVTPPVITDSNIDQTLDTLTAIPDTTVEATPVAKDNLNIPLNILENNYRTPNKVTENSITQSPHNTNTVVIPSTSRIPENSLNEMIVPSPFKRALFWPKPKDNVNKKKKEKIPSVITSLQWQKYHEDKENKKKKLQEEKNRRLEERKKKKEQNEETRKLKTAKKLAQKKTVKKKTVKTDYSSDSTSEEQWHDSGDSLDDISDEFENDDLELLNEEENNFERNKIKQSDYVIVNFPGKKKNHRFLCIVQNISPDGDIEVMAMVCCDQTKTVFKENDKDISVIRKSQIVEVLQPPNMIIAGDRIKYKFDSALQIDG